MTTVQNSRPPTASDDVSVWMQYLEEFSATYSSAPSLSSLLRKSDKEEIVCLIVSKIIEKIETFEEAVTEAPPFSLLIAPSDSEARASRAVHPTTGGAEVGEIRLMALLCDTLRLCLRDKTGIDSVYSAQLPLALLAVAGKLVPYHDVSLGALRALMNYLNGDEQAAKVFCCADVRGLDKLIHIWKILLGQHAHDHDLVVYIAKTLFMVLSMHSAILSASEDASGRHEWRSDAISCSVGMLRHRAGSACSAFSVGVNGCVCGAGAAGDGSDVVEREHWHRFEYQCSQYMLANKLTYALLVSGDSDDVSDSRNMGAPAHFAGPGCAVEAGRVNFTSLSAVIADMLKQPCPEYDTSNKDYVKLFTDCQEHAVQLTLLPKVGSLVVEELCTYCENLATISESNRKTVESVFNDSVNHQKGTLIQEACHDDILLVDNADGTAQCGLLVEMLHRLLRAIRHGNFGSEEQSAKLVPLLALLTQIATKSEGCLLSIKHSIFPTQQYILQGGESPGAGSSSLSKYSGQTTGTSNKMDPPPAPVTSMRYMLCKLMTSYDSYLKSAAAEFLFALCHDNKDEFVARTGYGNAVALLQLKGLI